MIGSESELDQRSCLAQARIVDMLLDEVPDAADQAEAFSRRIRPVLRVRNMKLARVNLHVLVCQCESGRQWRAQQVHQGL